jgi:hypothetical protein
MVTPCGTKEPGSFRIHFSKKDYNKYVCRKGDLRQTYSSEKVLKEVIVQVDKRYLWQVLSEKCGGPFIQIKIAI